MYKNKRCYDNSMDMNNDGFKFSGAFNGEVYPEATMPAMDNMNGMNSMPYSMNQGMPMNMGGCEMLPVYECPQERICHREFIHEVPHVCPINTRVINHHIYKHTYTPCYTCCEENVCSNVYEGSCCNF